MVVTAAPAAAEPLVEAIPYAPRDLPRRSQTIDFSELTRNVPNVPRSCLDILYLDPQAPSGAYDIDAGRGVIEVYCDMETDGGGYTMVGVEDAISTSRATDPNSCHELGLEIVVPRTREHWFSLLANFDQSYFVAIPGVSKATPGGNFTNVAMTSDTVPPGTWEALDGREWWLRSTPYSEPNGDYTADCWLGMLRWSADDIRFNDGSCGYATTKYVCSTNDKSLQGGNVLSERIDLGFEFEFFGETYTQVRISAGGFLNLGDTQGSCCAAEAIPSIARPNAIIAGYRGQLAPAEGGTVRWRRFGEAPDREFVIEYDGVPHQDLGPLATFQIVVREDGSAEVHCESCDSGGTTHTQGIEDHTGTQGITLRGRNFADFSVQRDAVRFRTDAEPDPEAKWAIVGTVMRDPDVGGNIVLSAADGEEVERMVLVAPGVYSLSGLVPGDYTVNALLDTNRNGRADDGEAVMEATVQVPPDALEVNFDFRTEEPLPDAGTDAASDADEPDTSDADSGSDAAPDVADQPDAADMHAEPDTPDTPDDTGEPDTSHTPSNPETGEASGCSTHRGGATWRSGLWTLALHLRGRR